MKSPFREHYKALVKLSFRRDYISRGTMNPTIVGYILGNPNDNLCIEVQFWFDGKNTGLVEPLGRTSHWHRGRMNTAPIEFVTVDEMTKTIEHEKACDAKHREII